MPKTRIYRINEYQPRPEGGAPEQLVESYLIEAPNSAQAIKHVARRFECEVATQTDCIELAAKGIKVEKAKAES